MNKKLRTLLIAGVMILGMSGNVFANGNGTDSCQVPGLRGDNHDGNSHHVDNITEASWNAFVEEFNRLNAGKFEIVPSGGKFKVMNAEGKQVEIIHVDFNKELTEEEKEAKSNEPVMPPQVPNLPEEEPETGDASTIGFLVAGALATLGLCKINKDEE